MADSVRVKVQKRSKVWDYFWIKINAGNQLKCKSCPIIKITQTFWCAKSV